MIKYSRLEHQFVQNIPSCLAPGVLYVSMEYGTAIHSCCCGCGEEVVTPFTPTDWRMTFDGETISLWPSVGNWNLPCRSHYVIKCGRVIEAGPWSDKKIAAERQRDNIAKAHYYDNPSPTISEEPTTTASSQSDSKGLWSKIARWFSTP